MEGLRKLYLGDFNAMSQSWQPDGSVIITLSKRGENKTYRFKVKDLYGEHEELLEHKVIPTKIPQWIKDRVKEAKEHHATSKPIAKRDIREAMPKVSGKAQGLTQGQNS